METVRKVFPLLLGCGGYALTLICPQPLFTGFHWQYDYFLLPLLLGLFYFFTRKSESSAYAVLSFAVTLLLCGAILSEIWTVGVSNDMILAGRLPYSDARNYLEGALRLLNDGSLTFWTSRRPLATSWLALNLAFSGENLKGCLALMAFWCALGIVSAACAVRVVCGNRSAWFAHTLLFFACRPYIGTTLSEQGGFFLGCIAFSLLLQSVLAWERRGRKFSFVLGLFVLAAGFLMRAGPFFVLPAIILWMAARERRDRLRLRKYLLVVCSAILLVFGLNGAILRTVGFPEAAFGNFSYTLYGLLHGGDWTQVKADHPEINQLSEAEANRATYALSFEEMRNNPLSLPKGALRAYKAFFVSSSGAYSFTLGSLARSADFDGLRSAGRQGREALLAYLSTISLGALANIVVALCWALACSFLGFWGGVKMIRENAGYCSFAFSAAVGIFLSVPFLPPWDAPLMRVYIVAVPFLVLFAALPLSVKAERDAPNANPLTRDGMEKLLGVLACLLVFIFPFAVRLYAPSYSANTLRDEAFGTELVKILKGSTVAPDEAAWDHFMSQRNRLAARRKDDRLSLFDEAASGLSLGFAYFPDSRSASYVCWDARKDDFPNAVWVAIPQGEGGFLRRLEKVADDAFGKAGNDG
jgi:4-amino-4-deoxy-L-arabinose transferase and related glycosyltransferases of PMT family